MAQSGASPSLCHFCRAGKGSCVVTPYPVRLPSLILVIGAHPMHGVVGGQLVAHGCRSRSLRRGHGTGCLSLSMALEDRFAVAMLSCSFLLQITTQCLNTTSVALHTAGIRQALEMSGGAGHAEWGQGEGCGWTKPRALSAQLQTVP